MKHQLTLVIIILFLFIGLAAWEDSEAAEPRRWFNAQATVQAAQIGQHSARLRQPKIRKTDRSREFSTLRCWNDESRALPRTRTCEVGKGD